MLAVSYINLGQTGTKPDGSPCDTASECKGGGCTGQGCGPGEGRCYTPPPPSRSDSGIYESARLPIQYCGCDGTTFITAAGYTPVKRYAYKGACKAAETEPPSGKPSAAPFYTRWWFWLAGVAVVGGAGACLLARRKR